MHITFVEVQNFRKLKSVRIDFSKKTTLLVGANNSGKTSAMLALRHFLVEPEKFSTNDFTLSNWALMETVAARWETQATTPTLSEWEPALPSLDVWLEIGTGEIHYVRRILPTLDWTGGALGVRLRFEPKVVEDLYKDYLAERKAVKDTKHAGSVARGTDREYTLKLWPETCAISSTANYGFILPCEHIFSMELLAQNRPMGSQNLNRCRRASVPSMSIRLVILSV